MRVSICLGAILIPENFDFHSGYSAPRNIPEYPKRTRPNYTNSCIIHDTRVGGGGGWAGRKLDKNSGSGKHAE